VPPAAAKLHLARCAALEVSSHGREGEV
ncbi:uncharacterized protein METZ01_LOCUS225418, partial [marine metagenome]